MSSSKPRMALAAKAIHLNYKFPGNLQKGWEAERTGDFTYMIHRSDGTTREVDLNVPLRTAKGDILPDRNPLGVLTIGEWSVIIGRGINHDLHARKLGAQNTYLVYDEDFRKVGQFKIGDEYKGTPVSLVDGHLLKIGEDIVPIKPKEYEVTLLVMRTPREGGLLSYINFIENGNAMNRKDGAPGTFYRPKKEGEPAEFVETHSGQKVVTALFWLEKNGEKVRFKYRDAQTAVMTTMVARKLEECRSIAISSGIDPADYDEYVDNEKKLQELNARWREVGMKLDVGPDLFRPDPKARVAERGYSDDGSEGMSR